ncbi:MAG: Bcr/CflA family multidrug efflux MFS transporter [Motiliproteus sp.]
MFLHRPLAVDSTALILLLGALAATAPLAIDMYLPALPAMAEGLNRPINQIQQTLTVFMLGYALCQLIYGPLSDRFGRRPVMLFGMMLFSVASLICTLAVDLEQLLLARTLQALGGGAASVVVTALVRDLYRGEAAARMMSLVVMSMTLAPLLAPLVGGQVLLWFGWRTIFLLLTLLGAVLSLVIWLRLPETRQTTPQRFSLRRMLCDYKQVLGHRQAMGYLLCGSFSTAGMFAFITASPFVYIEYYGVSEALYGLLFGCNIVLMMLLNWVNSRIIMRTGLATMIGRASLFQAIIGMLLLVSVLVLDQLAALFPLLVLFVGCIGLLGANCSAAVVSPFDRTAGSAAAILGTSRFLIGGLTAVAVSLLHDETALPMAMVISLCGVIGYCCFLFIASPTLVDTGPTSPPQ